MPYTPRNQNCRQHGANHNVEQIISVLSAAIPITRCDQYIHHADSRYVVVEGFAQPLAATREQDKVRYSLQRCEYSSASPGWRTGGVLPAWLDWLVSSGRC